MPLIRMMFMRVVYHLRSKVQLYYISSKTQNLKQLPARYQFSERRKHRLLNVLRTSPNPSLAFVLFHRFLFPFHVALVDEEKAKECYPVIVVVDDGFAGVERTLVVADF